MDSPQPHRALRPPLILPLSPLAAPFFAAKLLESACLCVEKQLDEVTTPVANMRRTAHEAMPGAPQADEGSDEAKQLAKEAAAYMLEANGYFQQNGNYERALEAIQKAAK